MNDAAKKTTASLRRRARALSDRMQAAGTCSIDCSAEYQTIVAELLRRGCWDW